MHQHRRSRMEKFPRFQQPAPRVEQALTLVGNADIHAEMVMLLQKRNNLLAEMVNVNHQPFHAGSLQATDGSFQQGLPVQGDKGLGAVIRQGPQAGAQTGSEYHPVHGSDFNDFILDGVHH